MKSVKSAFKIGSSLQYRSALNFGLTLLTYNFLQAINIYILISTRHLFLQAINIYILKLYAAIVFCRLSTFTFYSSTRHLISAGYNIYI